ncbi:MAG: hypothetical protein M1837_000180 [Sclerophora amabilis]|nr:MAG: hypothetical protein M1837_000180 [Sclerophora amabilis]
MSEPIPESIPTSQDPRSRRATKKRAVNPQASEVDALFAHPERDIVVPPSATTNGKPRTLAAPPEIVANVQGSSAGAGSGEFHVYKASRRREYERLRLMEEEVKKEKEAEEFKKRKEELHKKDQARTNKNRAKREKMKARKQGGKGGAGKDDGSGAGGKAVDLEAGRLPVQPIGQLQSGDLPELGQGVQPAPETIGVIIHDDD